jgi:hypothetical protein
MRLIIAIAAMLLRLFIVSLPLLLVCCAHKPAPIFDNIPECTSMHIPTDEEFMKMPYTTLSGWSKNAKLAQDLLATATVTHQPVDPCVTTLAYKGYTIIDQAMKYR